MADDRKNTLNLTGQTTQTREPRSLLPWVIAGVVVVVAIVLLFVFSGHKAAPANPGGAGLAAADPYAASLPITGLKMSESTNFAGGKVTYVDGHIANKGDKTVTGITVQVAFRDFGNQLVQKNTLPLSLIRMREPYVDTQPVSADPLKPGDERDFRIILDTVAQDWNGQYPEVRVIQVTGK
ncbi:MAG TPA: DUF2393 family protein [Pseudacidobacterium sp.]|jgi:hypothetical protein|nr:DUF2393 family protein [Pseudacidobacterium sp.]